jgi:hypothetical protein
LPDVASSTACSASKASIEVDATAAPVAATRGEDSSATVNVADPALPRAPGRAAAAAPALSVLSMRTS